MAGTRYLTQEEINVILHYLPSATDRCLFILGCYTGFRISELLSLQVSDIITHNAINTTSTVWRKYMKGKQRSRTVVLHPKAQEALRIYLPLASKQINTKLFPVDRTTAHRHLKRAVNLAGLNGKIATHSMRKTFAIRVYENSDKNLVTTQMALGHVSLSSTSHYLSVGQDLVDKAILDIK